MLSGESMKYLYAKIIGMVVALGIISCTGPVDTPSSKVMSKDTKVLFSEIKTMRSNSRQYVYMVEGISGQHYTLGNVNCLKTFNIELGKPYTVKLDYINDKVVLVKDLCEFTARLKARSLM